WATRRLLARPSLREIRGTDRAAADPSAGRCHLCGSGGVLTLASGFRSGLPRGLAALRPLAGHRRLPGVSAAYVGPRRPPSPAPRSAAGPAGNGPPRPLAQSRGVAVLGAFVGRATPGELLANHQLAWWLAAAAGVAVTATSWRLPRHAAAARAIERGRCLAVSGATTSSPSTIVAGEPT